MDRAVEVFATLAETARTDDLTHIEFLARLVAEQASATRNRRLAARMRYARFPFRRTIDEFDFEFQPTIDRRLVDDLATLRFMADGRPILFLGQPGCGKTHCETQGPPVQPGHGPGWVSVTRRDPKTPWPRRG